MDDELVIYFSSEDDSIVSLHSARVSNSILRTSSVGVSGMMYSGGRPVTPIASCSFQN